MAALLIHQHSGADLWLKATHIKQTLLPTCDEIVIVGDNTLTVNLQPGGKGCTCQASHVDGYDWFWTSLNGLTSILFNSCIGQHCCHDERTPK